MNTDFQITDPAIPIRMKAALQGYIDRGEPVGHFLSALLSNDLFLTVAYADSVSMQLIPNFVRELYNNTPSTCHGSLKKMNDWIARGGLNKERVANLS